MLGLGCPKQAFAKIATPRPAKYDSEIAAVASVNQLVVVTRNTEDFKDFNGLRVENWFD
ncbi:hypothetical protein BHECKSOX_1185 [Bathymodiolus heckerae thiotrophic gill symbiont]|nr:hypothetical protein BHECKSOX_1185 [Bathymodiolus heckerae thiotrophic gill symbiont]